LLLYNLYTNKGAVNVNIFLDANILYTDPFLVKTKLIVLKKLAKTNDANIYICEAVVSEIKRGHLNFIKQNLESLKSAAGKLNSCIQDQSKKVKIETDFNYFDKQFDDLINFMKTEGIINVIPYCGEIVEQLVDIDMHKKYPFFKLVDGKEKKSIRDAIIWHSYTNYIKKNNKENCYFISDNTKDFADDHKKAQRKDSLSYEISDNLENNLFKSCHKSVDNFLEFYNFEIKKILQNQYIEELNEEDFEELIKDILEDVLLETDQVTNDYFDINQLPSYNDRLCGCIPYVF
jgi:hypothetical protein